MTPPFDIDVNEPGMTPGEFDQPGTSSTLNSVTTDFRAGAKIQPATTTMGDLDGALGRIAAVIATANPTHGRRWRGMRSAEHVARALKHVIEWQVGHDPEDIEHAACLLLMGLQLELETRREPDAVACGPLGLIGRLSPNGGGS